MKRVLKISLSAIAVALIALTCFVPAFAEGDKLKVNGAEAAEGDVITYTLNLGECDDLIEGFQMYLFYNTEYLEVVEGSLSFPNVPGALYNDAEEGKIPANFSSVSNLLDFSKKKVFLTVQFRVLKAGESDVTYFITELYGDDMTYLKNFKFTNDIEINGKKAVKNAAPKLVEDQKTIDAFQGGFINYSDGQGDPNAEKDGKKSDDATTSDTDAAYVVHQAVTGDMTNPDVTHVGAVDAVEVTKGDGDDSGDDNFAVPIIVGIIAVAVAALMVLRFVVLGKHE